MSSLASTGGTDESSNLALACGHCNRHKGPNLSGIDPETGSIQPLFHPRRQPWEDHFAVREGEAIGLTPCSRATVQLFQMNDERRVALRGG